jgi:hypothetical protein
VLMFRLIWIASVHTPYFLRRSMPTNIALDAIRTRRGLKWDVPAILLAVPTCTRLKCHSAAPSRSAQFVDRSRPILVSRYEHRDTASNKSLWVPGESARSPPPHTSFYTSKRPTR